MLPDLDSQLERYADLLPVTADTPRITLGVFPWKFKGGEAAFCRAVAWA